MNAPVVPVVASARWPESDVDTVTPVTGFVVSTFNPLVAEVAARCLAGHPLAERTAIVLASATGDRTSAEAVAEAVAAGTRVAPLLFFQSNPNAVLGHVAARWGLTGPVVCTSPTGDPMADALACADLLFASGEADAALVITAELADDRGGTDRAHAVLVTARERA
ncbi:3-oxoacyl-(acyl-carrier-protein) synthase [Actinokineospora baliensis]|uniref:beta-ketoacyl synthase chain length factor n=1 Tax=Actinokineospora baliensis TaxID=547056 RepID=UPI00195C68FE|nr:beta-ketoacyl synthase chain length factor [Actinokineospora baliensis]MBM7773710.1 3-oxoacyl-(acyl-carrier-protein) synthase [Actinokineospora baliensis]